MKEKEIKEDQEAKADSKTAETPAPQELGKKAKEAKETKASQKPQDSQDSDDPKEPAEEEEHEESLKEAIAKQAIEDEAPLSSSFTLRKNFGRRHSDGTSDTPADMAHRVSGVLYHHIHIQQIQHTTGHDRDRPTAGGTAERQIQSPVEQQPDNRKKPREQRAENAAEQQRQRPAHCHPATIHHKRTGE